MNQRNYPKLVKNIDFLLEEGRKLSYITINQVLIQTYWNIGRLIVEHEQKGENRAIYGAKLIEQLSKDLKEKHEKGFGRKNLQLMRLLYVKYPQICQEVSSKFQVSHTALSSKFQVKPSSSLCPKIDRKVSGEFQIRPSKLTWSHYCELLSVSDDLARSFYEKQCIKENWSVRELKRQINSMLFERLALTKNKTEILKLAKHGQTIESDKDIVKDPYFLEFLGIPENHTYSEKELEQKIIDNLQMFLLELGKGFTFVQRQFRITLNNTHFYIDLVFYHRILKCFVLIDLKIGKVGYEDIGQMNMYLNYFKNEENTESDNPPIGIILAADKDEIMVEYALGGISNKLFVSKYKIYLPNKLQLKKLICNSVLDPPEKE